MRLGDRCPVGLGLCFAPDLVRYVLATRLGVNTFVESIGFGEILILVLTIGLVVLGVVGIGFLVRGMLRRP
jgi:hypothetical protein